MTLLVNDNISSTLKNINFESFRHIIILGKLPVITCTCEQSLFSKKRLKTYNRTTTISERLNVTVLMHVQQEFAPDIEKVIDLFAVTNRRLNFI